MTQNKIKYPRTLHLPWSPGLQKDDRRIHDLSILETADVIITEKMDGENTTIYSDYIHARSTNSGNHKSRTWVKNLQARIGWQLPENMRICGENLYAKHSIHYKNLESYFLVFSIWKGDQCLSWEVTENLCEKLGLCLVPVLYRGPFQNVNWETLAATLDSKEGYVVRISSSFFYKDFSLNIAKYVRANHVQTNQHWLNQTIILNECKEKTN